MNIIWKLPNGHLAITMLVEAENAKEHAKELKERGDLPSDWEAVAFGYPATEFPTAMSQDAWAWDGARVVIDLAFAKVSTAARLRAERDVLLPKLDVQFQRALETGQDTTAIVAEKQRLRDLPGKADGCTTIAELNALHA